MTNNLKSKRVLVMGLGLHGGGVGTVKFLARSRAKITITDLRSARLLKTSLKELKKLKNIKYVLGKHRKKDFTEADLVIKNPSVKPDSPYLKLAYKNRVPVTTDLGIFFKLCPGKIIGVTGTRGKSTTAYLIWRFLRNKYRRTLLGGNIRKSVLELLPKIRKNDWVVLELSSFQLQDLSYEKQSPQIAVFTNIFKDHLNWHKNFREYLWAKSQIFTYQKKEGYLFLNPDDETVKRLAKKATSRLVYARLPQKFEKLVDKNLGRHYRSSVGLACAVAKHFGIKEKYIKNVLENFHGLEGRQEKVAVIRGVNFINDTTATIPDATIAALKRFRGKTKNKIILIAGGQDKKLDFRPLAAAIKKYASILILLPGSATAKLKRSLHITNHIYNAKSMREAVSIAQRLAKKGDYILLSPGAASFGLFLNEFDRGEKFINEIKKLKNAQHRR